MTWLRQSKYRNDMNYVNVVCVNRLISEHNLAPACGYGDLCFNVCAYLVLILKAHKSGR